jgi:hypothetical protein
MFLLNEMILLSPLAVYSYIRIFTLLAHKASKIIFTAAFVIVLAGFPFAESLSHRPGAGWTKIIIIAGYDCLPLLLYLVMTVILLDAVIGVGRLLKLISKETVRSPRFRLGRLCASLIIPALVVTVGIINFHWLRVREYSVEVPRKESSLPGLTIAFAADFHLGAITGKHFMEKFVAKVNALDPDIVLIGGDILEGHRRDEDTGRFETEFLRLRSKFGVFAVPGNHERYGGGRKEFFTRAGVRLLEDAVEKIDNAFYLAGRKDDRSRNRKSVEDLLQDTPDDLPVILLAHRPTDLENVSRTNVDIQLSGHTHHGQLFPVNWITSHEYELSWGYMIKRRTHVFVTSGVQLWGPLVRTTGASEILVIRVAFRG